MSGYAKRAFDNYIIKTTSDFYKIIKKYIIPALPTVYTFEDIYSLLEKFYPYEIRAFEFNLSSFAHQDQTLQKTQHRKRYNVKTAKQYIMGSSGIKYVLSREFLNKRSLVVDTERITDAYQKLEKKRIISLAKMNTKVQRAQEKAQQIEPVFLDSIIGLYDRKGVSQKDRVYILHELYKYDCLKVTNFMRRLLVHEQNFQIREMALKHLQNYGYKPILRAKDTIPINIKNKKKRESLKTYRNKIFSIKGIPEELEYLIDNSKAHQITSYDYFISHSFLDHDDVQRIISELNKMGKLLYCDWISDNDYLKRNLLCEATLSVIECRIIKSDAVLFVDSVEARNSIWVAYELQYANNNGKKIVSLKRNNSVDQIVTLQDYWFEGISIDKNKLIGKC